MHFFYKIISAFSLQRLQTQGTHDPQLPLKAVDKVDQRKDRFQGDSQQSHNN